MSNFIPYNGYQSTDKKGADLGWGNWEDSVVEFPDDKKEKLAFLLCSFPLLSPLQFYLSWCRKLVLWPPFDALKSNMGPIEI